MKPRKIVVGVDFGAESEEAVAQALRLARQTGAELALVHVGVALEPERAEAASRDRVARAELAREQRDADRARLDALCARIVDQGVVVSPHLVEGFADATLAAVGKELGADLLVVGTHGRTGVRRLLLGSVAERTVRLAASSVLVARPGPSPVYRRILVPTDFSPHAEAALETAIELAAAPDAIVDVVHFWSIPWAASEVPVDLASGLEADARDAGAALIARHQGKVRLAFEDVLGDAAHGVLDLAGGDEPYDLIVMGSHGRRGFRRMLLGSTAETTVRHAPCSVMVVHLPADR